MQGAVVHFAEMIPALPKNSQCYLNVFSQQDVPDTANRRMNATALPEATGQGLEQR